LLITLPAAAAAGAVGAGITTAAAGGTAPGITTLGGLLGPLQHQLSPQKQRHLLVGLASATNHGLSQTLALSLGLPPAHLLPVELL